MKTLSAVEIAAALPSLPGWTFSEGVLQRRYAFSKYLDGIRFVEAVAAEAEREHHHPDILVRLSDVTLFLSSREQGGVTEADLALAHEIARFAPDFGASDTPT